MDYGRDPAADEPLERHDRADPRVSGDVSARPGDGSLSRLDAAKDEQFRRWDVVSPSATLIGRPADPEDDVSENLRRLHNERHPAMAGHSERMHRLEKARITHALCSALGLTRWERDRALGIVTDLDLTAFGSQRSIPKVALVVVQHVVDAERRRLLGLDDAQWIAGQDPEALETLYEEFESITDDPGFRALMETFGLDVTSVNRLDRVLRDQIEEQDLDGAVFGRQPHRDPSLPVITSNGSRGGPPADAPSVDLTDDSPADPDPDPFVDGDPR